ncbi:MAG: hypothetical protein V2I24_09215 [Halieaceae bacterium]|jgi:hypothetical protein|nr:hypothetical protein [Halieaceae bacterium]
MATPSALTTDREAWLTEAASLLLDTVVAPACQALGHEYTSALADLGDSWRVACGWPIGSRAGARRGIAGQCFARSASAAGLAEVFISPRLYEGPQVLATLLHELLHAVDDCRDGHRGRFAAMARAVGFVAPLTELHLTDALTAELAEMAELLPPYPHAALDVNAGRKKQGTRMVKVECGACGFLFRTTAKHLAALDESSPCPACHQTESLLIDGSVGE